MRCTTFRLKKLKEMGSNAYRCSHYMVSRELLDAAIEWVFS
jgi:beta-galactosidase/beta-glucuronidase